MSLYKVVIITILALAVAAPTPASAAPAKARGSKASKREAALAKALAGARAQRAAVVAEARALARSDGAQAGAGRLAEAAIELDDAALTVEAAAAYQEVRSRDAALRAVQLVSAAREQLAAFRDPAVDLEVDVRGVRLTREEVEALTRRCAVIDEEATALHQKIAARERAEARARKQVRAGAALLGVGAAGLAVLAGGLAVRADRRDKLAAIAGEEPRYDLSQLDAQGGRATGMIAAGAVVGALGMVIGGALVGVGARELRGGRASRHARVQVAPTTAGLLIVGRF